MSTNAGRNRRERAESTLVHAVGRIDGAEVESEDPSASTFRIEYDDRETLDAVIACIPSVFDPVDRDRDAGWILVQYRYVDRDRERLTA